LILFLKLFFQGLINFIYQTEKERKISEFNELKSLVK